MSQENKNIQQRVEHEFVNSTDAGQSILRLARDPPAAVVRRLVAKFIGLLVHISWAAMCFLSTSTWGLSSVLNSA